MKLKLVVLLCSVGTLTASPSFSQQKKMDVSYDRVSLTVVLNDLKLKTGYRFVYFGGVIPEAVTVTMSQKDATIEEVLDKVLIPNGLNYSIDGDVVIVSSTDSPSGRQQAPAFVTVGGVVTSIEGRPLAGVTVIIPGTNYGVASDSEGRFSLRFPQSEGVVIRFSFIGKKDVEVPYAGQTNLTVKMEDAASEIGLVVVTGVFDRPRESYTGAVTMISERELKMYRGQNLLATIRNIDPAVNIVADNDIGSNPNRPYEINIRGNSSLPMTIDELGETAGNQLNAPLVILDGFEISIQKLVDFNDEDIQSINILKDASATSIYGSRGANGVIVITTKTPQPGRLKIFLQAGLNLEIPDLSSYDLLGAQEKLLLEREVGIYDYASGPTGELTMNRLWNERWNDALRGGTDWLRQPVRVGTGQKLNLTLEGGSEEFRWGVSVNNNSVKGSMKGSERNVSNAAITLSYTYKNLLFRNQASYGYTLADNGTYGNFSEYAKLNEYFRARDENGELIESWRGWPYRIYNPLADAQLNSKDQTRIHVINDVFSVDWTIVEGLKLRGQLGVTKTFTTTDKYLSPNHSSFSLYDTEDNFFRRGTYDYTTGESMAVEAAATLSYSKLFAEKHMLYVGVNTQVAQSESDSYNIRAEGLLNEKFDDLSNALQYAEGTSPSGSDSRTSRIGFTGNINYTYDNRYFVDGSFRLDGSSQFGTNNKYAPFWSLGVGWNIHNEQFMADRQSINMLRLRLAYGQTGSQQFSAYQARSMYNLLSSSRYMWWTAAELMGLGNENLRWQKTDQWNAGVDLQILDNRITAGLDVYYKLTSNLLSSIDIPQAHGFRTYAENIGEVKNYGFEAMLGGYIIRNSERGIFWNMTGKMSYTENKVTKLSDAMKEQVEARRNTTEYGRLLYEGRSQNSIYAVHSLGIDPIDGREIYLDKNGEITKTWRASDRVYCGVGEPTYRGNISTMFSYKDFTLNLSFAYHWGGVLYNQTLIDKVEVGIQVYGSTAGTDMVDPGNIVNNVDRRVLTERWQKPGDVRFFKGYSNEDTRSSTRFVMDDNVFELQSVNLQYRWHTPFVKENLCMESVNFAVNMGDVFYLSSIKRERGISYPFARNVQMMISLNF